MEIAIVGAHGKVARRLARLLVERGDRVRGVIRRPDQSDALRAEGVEPVVCDIEHAGTAELAAAVEGSDAVVFAAGAGAGSGPERKWTVDRDGATKLIDAARAAGIDRYVMVGSIGTDDPPRDDSVFSVYLRAKAEADAALMRTDLRWTIVRPVSLLDDPGSGRVTLTTDEIRGKVARDDVAAVLAAVLHEPRSEHRVLYVAAGDEPIETALDATLG
jgi:uncharacterized protein YbjT (DUF2867 family)